jgi:hypothetical protein
MAQTNTKSDDFCSYNTSAAPFYWTFEPYQYANTFVFGEVGINSSGGSAGSYVRPDVVDVDSFLSGRDDILSKCNPPVPALDEVNKPPIVIQNSENINILIPKYTREKKSATDLGSIDYNRWQPNLPVEPQDLRFVIEDFAPQRGGMDTSSYNKLAWNSTIKHGAAVNGPRNSCETILDPARACGPYCADVNGYMPDVKARPMTGKPLMEPNYPFEGPTSQQIKEVGAAACGPNMFYGDNFDQGSCGAEPVQTVLTGNNPNTREFLRR